jgi:hypothetical protein
MESPNSGQESAHRTEWTRGGEIFYSEEAIADWKLRILGGNVGRAVFSRDGCWRLKNLRAERKKE